MKQINELPLNHESSESPVPKFNSLLRVRETSVILILQ